MIQLRLTESIAEISKKINKALSEDINEELRKKRQKIEYECKLLAQDWIVSCPEIQALRSGALDGPFGMYPGDSAFASGEIEYAVYSSVSAQFVPVSQDLKRGGITINFQPSNFINLLELKSGHVIYENGDLHWLKWMLEYGDRVIVTGYNYVKSAGGRSGLGTMKVSGSFRVPPQVSGTAEDNFITRALTGQDKENKITALLESILK